MYRTLFVTINLLLSSQIIIAGQNDPWDNTLEAVLFVSSQTDLDGDGTTGVGDLLLVIDEWGICGGCTSDLDENGTVDVSDLLTLIDAWGPNEINDLEIDVPNAGVPCFSYGPSGELIQMFQWFPNGDSALDFIARRVSTDQGESWTEIQAIQWVGGPKVHSTQADPSLVLLEDDSWRLYFTCDIDAAGPSLPVTYSAISDDGLIFTWEDWKDPRMSLSGSGLLDPSVIYFEEQYHFFAPVPGQGHGSIYATSSDGFTFIQQDNIVVDGHDDTKFLGNPSIVNGKLYFFGTLEPTEGVWGGVFIAESEDAVNWTVLYEELGNIADPAGIQTDEGLMIFKTVLYN